MYLCTYISLFASLSRAVIVHCSMGNNANVDTSSFRHAIWNYIQCLYGIRHDDYDYELVDQLLERNLKSYIRTVAFHPERVMQEDYSRFMADLKHSEKVSYTSSTCVFVVAVEMV